MTDRPILFSTPMMQALLAGHKTQTRRVLKKKAALDGLAVFGPNFLLLPGNIDLVGKAVGDRLWVREAWSAIMTGGWTIADARRGICDTKIVYRADGNGFEDGDGWWPSIHMPREFSRLTLTITDVRVQRLQDISEADAMAEGAGRITTSTPKMGVSITACEGFQKIWTDINGAGSWEKDPWVVATTFTVRHGNIDNLGGAL